MWLQCVRATSFSDSCNVFCLVVSFFLSLLTTSEISDHSWSCHWGLPLYVGIVREMCLKVGCKVGFCEGVSYWHGPAMQFDREEWGGAGCMCVCVCMFPCLGLKGLGD